ncbi:MAG: TIGR01458 family HAD-type hydrolase [Anaerolineales bacterium]|nr:TIGR01458 family HAD-type hydrolase [Anaerolineales bacterium]MCB9126408.1 TIGR01458 family HAD-type hydrolase [Ardenticatenales bacterium]MCB9171569.1 TIGR01458 family HAD-type hydrolase [Ardenticatenales bacterium]
MRGILFDIDGVFYNAGQPIEGGAATVAQMRAWGVPLRFLTNTSTLSRQDLAERLGRFGIPTAPEEIIHPPSAAAAWLRAQGVQGVALFVKASAATEFAGLPLLESGAETGAGAVVVGDLGEEWGYAALTRAFRLLHANPAARLIALGMTRYWHAPDGLRLDVGPFAALLAMAAEREPLVLGKPAPQFFAQAIAALGLPANQIVMVGDDVDGDVGGAQRAGMQGVLVRTGKYRDGDLDRSVRPDGVLPSVAALPDWWQREAG